MAQEKPTSTTSGPLGFTSWDIVWLLLVAVLIIGLIPTRWWVVQRPVEPPPTPSEAAVVSPTETPATIPANTPTEESILTSTPQSTATSTSTPIKTPTTMSTSVPPTFTLTQAPPTSTPDTPSTPTATSTPLPTATPTPPTPSSTPPPPTPAPASIVYIQGNDNLHELQLINQDGDLIKGLQQYAVAPGWSPDGKKIAFFGEPGIENLGDDFTKAEGLWTIDPSSGTVDQICSENSVKNIAWSPDGSKLAYEYTEADKDSKVLVVYSGDCEGEPIKVFFGEQPAWKNPEELFIRAVRDPTGPAGLRLINIITKNPRQVTKNEGDSFPAWSSDDKYLAFASDKRSEDSNSGIYLLEWSDPSRKIRPLVIRSSKDTTPVFSPDSKEIYFLSDVSGHWQIRAITLDGKNERIVVEDVGSIDDWSLARPAVR